MSPRLSTLAASAALALPLLALTPAASFAVDDRTLIDFESDAFGQGPSFVSDDHKGVTFCATGAGAQGLWLGEAEAFPVPTEDPYSAGQLLGVVYNLAMTFAEPVDSLELSFGYDGGSIEGEIPVTDAVLRLYLGETLVDTTRVAPNGDRAVNQVIGAPGDVIFNRAVLGYAGDGTGDRAPIIVDNVRVGQPVLGSANPEVPCSQEGPAIEPEPGPAPFDPRACTIVGTSEADVLVGTSERDVICGRGGDDVIKGLGGDDLLIGGAGDDRIRGFGGDDEVRGNAGRDLMWGGAGTDTAFGGDGLDLAFGFEVLQSVRSVD